MRTLGIFILVCACFYGIYFLMRKYNPNGIFDPLVKQVENVIGEKVVDFQDTCAVRVLSPEQNSIIENPVRLEVVIDNRKDNCSWVVFEANGGNVELVSQTGKTLAKDFLRPTGEWMTSDPVTYTAILPYPETYKGKMRIVVTEDDPSGNKKPGQFIRTIFSSN